MIKDKLTMNTEAPKKGDYVQLLDAQGRPSENFTLVGKWTAELGMDLFLIEDTDGESHAVFRKWDGDNEVRNAWIEVITDAPCIKVKM